MEVEEASIGVDGDVVAVLDAGERAAERASATWMAAGTLPDAPDIRLSVTIATRCPRSCRTSAGVSLYAQPGIRSRLAW